MPRTYTAGIRRYDDKRGQSKKLLGLITFTDGKSLKVWESSGLHKECERLAQFPLCEVRYQFKHSDKWGDSLEMIQPTQAEHELYDDARSRDEEVGHYATAGSWLGHRISKAVQRHVEGNKEQ